jgi:hypothetical protein
MFSYVEIARAILKSETYAPVSGFNMRHNILQYASKSSDTVLLVRKPEVTQ